MMGEPIRVQGELTDGQISMTCYTEVSMDMMIHDASHTKVKSFGEENTNEGTTLLDKPTSEYLLPLPRNSATAHGSLKQLITRTPVAPLSSL